MVYAGGFINNNSSSSSSITPVTVAFFPVIFQQIKLLISCLKTLTKTILIALARRNCFFSTFCVCSFPFLFFRFFLFIHNINFFLFCLELAAITTFFIPPLALLCLLFVCERSFSLVFFLSLLVTLFAGCCFANALRTAFVFTGVSLLLLDANQQRVRNDA